MTFQMKIRKCTDQKKGKYGKMKYLYLLGRKRRRRVLKGMPKVAAY